ncbi:hypothetical protein EEB14_08645 [Rhodococcus sp. WS4]|nr:hypothetical protein EEB14_08645 [Rhodococcus sp. WS4]
MKEGGHRRALRAAGGEKKRAAMQLGISRTTLYTAMRQYGIDNVAVSKN